MSFNTGLNVDQNNSVGFTAALGVPPPRPAILLGLPRALQGLRRSTDLHTPQPNAHGIDTPANPSPICHPSRPSRFNTDEKVAMLKRKGSFAPLEGHGQHPLPVYNRHHAHLRYFHAPRFRFGNKACKHRVFNDKFDKITRTCVLQKCHGYGWPGTDTQGWHMKTCRKQVLMTGHRHGLRHIPPHARPSGSLSGCSLSFVLPRAKSSYLCHLFGCPSARIAPRKCSVLPNLST